MFYSSICTVVFFFFKQKTAYEMRISDWSSDVCSSDLVDFSIPAALDANLAAARAARTPIVIGTTGLGDAHHALIDEAAREIAVLQTGITSLGVTLLATLVREAAARLGPDWDIEIVEMPDRTSTSLNSSHICAYR